jgi:phosphoribosyl-ATP pyrophosphohydrolase/phosphoribosyl-AMP cyclohydrolase
MTAMLDFSKCQGLVPVVVQHVRTRQVLMLGFMNEEAYRVTLDTRKITFFSRTKNQLWTKGATSGHFLTVCEILVDCDQDTLLIKADPHGPVCHTGSDTCFGESIHEGVLFLDHLARTIAHRRAEPSLNSYTSGLFASGLDRMAQKVGEEAVEVVIEAKNDTPERLVNEASDLLFHLMVLLEAKGVPFASVIERLQERHK